MPSMIVLLFIVSSVLYSHYIKAETVDKQAVPIDRVVVVVNDDVITQSELDSELDMVKKQLQQQNTMLPSARVLEEQVLERMIQKHLQLQVAASNHIRVEDETLNRTILRIASDNKLTLGQFRDVLEKDGFNFANYRENIRNEIIISRLRQREINSKITVTEQEVKDFLTNREAQGSADDEYHLAHILVAIPEAASAEQVQAAKQKAQNILNKLRSGEDFAQTAIAMSDGQQALQGGDLGWRKLGQLPLLFSSLVNTMKVSDISELIRSPSGFHIIKLLEKRQRKGKHIITQTKARHILIRTNELVSDKDAVTRLKQLKQRIEHGEDFAELARSHSDDTASAVNGGDLGWVNPGALVPQFEQVMNSLKPKEMSEPFKTEYGWHVVQVLDRREHDNTDEQKVAQAKEQIFQRKVEEETQNWLRRLRDEAYVDIRL